MGRHGVDDDSQEVDSREEVDVSQLPTAPFMGGLLYKWEGFWFFPNAIKGASAFKQNFEGQDGDVILASTLKTGTTWLKALCISIMEKGRKAEREEEDILVKSSPHILIHNLEINIFAENANPDLSSMKSPRLFSTHLPYTILPDSIKNSSSSKCKIVYITRNPKDTLVSLWHFFKTIERPQFMGSHSFEEAFKAFCNEEHPFGPFFDHVLGYWEESLKMPEKILFLKYEELKRDPKGQVKRLANFLGRPFEDEDDVDDLLWRCSLERLKNLEVNKNGRRAFQEVPNSAYFRLGVVGDWQNHFTNEMKQHLDQMTRTKLEASGLDLDA